MSRKAKQMEFEQDDWKKFLKTELGQSMEHFVTAQKRVEQCAEEMEEARLIVMVEMRKAGKKKLRPQIGGVFYDFELKSAEEKLKFKVAKP